MYLIPSINIHNIYVVNHFGHNLRSLLHFLVLVLRLCLFKLLFTRVVPLPLLVNNPSMKVQPKQRLLGSIGSNQRPSAPEQKKKTKEGQKNLCPATVEPTSSTAAAHLDLLWDSRALGGGPDEDFAISCSLKCHSDISSH
jgi:hypothetical protein